MPSIDDIRERIEPFHAELYQCVIRAWERWKAEFSHLLQLPYPRCRANVMYDLMIEEARKRFDGFLDVAIVEGVQRCLIRVGDILLRFKKVDKQLRTRNYPTQGALQFDRQLQLPGIPKGIRVTIGYRIDEIQQALGAVFVILARGKEILGFYELLPVEGEALGPLPMAPIVPFPGFGEPGRRIARKVEKVEEKGEEGKADDKEQK